MIEDFFGRGVLEETSEASGVFMVFLVEMAGSYGGFVEFLGQQGGKG